MATKTRKQRTTELLQRLERGTGNQTEEYRLWVSTWIIPELEKLIPEAKEILRDIEYHQCSSKRQLNKE